MMTHKHKPPVEAVRDMYLMADDVRRMVRDPAAPRSATPEGQRLLETVAFLLDQVEQPCLVCDAPGLTAAALRSTLDEETPSNLLELFKLPKDK